MPKGLTSLTLTDGFVYNSYKHFISSRSLFIAPGLAFVTRKPSLTVALVYKTASKRLSPQQVSNLLLPPFPSHRMSAAILCPVRLT